MEFTLINLAELNNCTQKFIQICHTRIFELTYAAQLLYKYQKTI